MTHFAPVSPLQGLQELDRSHILGEYQLLIAPIVIKQDWAYQLFFHEHPGQMIIIDNGLIELGYAMSGRQLAEAARIVHASVVIMPDTIDDGLYTVKQVRMGLEEFRRYDDETPTMGVVQGINLEECLACAKELVKAGVDWLGVPRGLTPNLGSRVELVQLLGELWDLPMHVLGFSDNMADDIQAAVSHPKVVGIDAATPMWTKEWFPLHPPADPSFSQSLGRRPEKFWTEPVSERAGHNVETVRRWIRDAQGALTERVVPVPPQGQ